jgi:hypothetical protein
MTNSNIAVDVQSTIQHILSGIREKRMTLVDALTSTPIHPYEKLKYIYLDQKGLSAINIDDVPPVSGFELSTITNQITSINQKVMDDIFTRVPFLSSQTIFDNPQAGNVFATLSADEYIIDEERMSKHLAYTEMIKTITAEQIDKNPIEIAQKILSQFVITYT